MAPHQRGERRRGPAALALACALALGVGCAGDDPTADPTVVAWAAEDLGLDDARAACVGIRVARLDLDPAEVDDLVGTGLAGLDPDRRQTVGDAVTVCASATDAELESPGP